MAYPKFETSTFEGPNGKKVADITGIAGKFLPEHLQHYHVTMHQGSTALGEWAGRAIIDSGRPVLYVRRNGAPKLLPEGDFPDDGRAYKFTSRALFVRLDRLPFRYEHRGATNGGLGASAEFMQPYNHLKTEMAKEAERRNFSGGITRILDDPSVMTGAGFVLKQMPVWKHVVWHAMRELYLWDDAFERLHYNDGDNCIEGYPTGFDFALLQPVIEEFGGWVDFKLGIREAENRASVLCNFTTTSSGNGIRAIVQSASASTDQLTNGQRAFMEAVFEAYGVRDKV